LKTLTNVPGLYGKIPVRGDFVTRRLKAGFVDTWDKWLQDALSTSKAQLGDQWLDIYLTSPIWHFVLSPGICGATSWAGILTPSVDKVGRYFPLTFAVPVGPHRSASEIFINAADWFERLEQLALSVLEENLDLAELDSKLQEQTLPGASTPKATIDASMDASADASVEEALHNGENKGPLALHMNMDQLDQTTEAFAQLGFRLLAQCHPTHSLWRTNGSASMKPCLRVYEHLPPGDAFYQLLIGRQGPAVREAKEEKAPATPPGAHPAGPAAAPDFGTIEKQPIQWRSYGATTRGHYRNINEDAYLERAQIGLWAVADGMGGHSAGDVASRAVIEGLLNLTATGHLESYTAYAIQCLRTVNADLIEMAGHFDDRRIIGTTVVVMLAVGKRCAAIWAGDSRLYQLRDGTLTQLTCDHSLANEFSQRGILTGEEGDTQKMGNVVTRALGANPELSFDVVNFETRAGDVYLLCSDGLIKEVQHQEIADIMAQGRCRPVARALIDLALERGARDNVTVVVARAGQIGDQ
jgi:type VI secretion system protein ImpM